VAHSKGGEEPMQYKSSSSWFREGKRRKERGGDSKIPGTQINNKELSPSGTEHVNGQEHTEGGQENQSVGVAFAHPVGPLQKTFSSKRKNDKNGPTRGGNLLWLKKNTNTGAPGS